MKKYLFPLIFLIANFSVLAEEFDPKTLIMPMEIWETEIPAGELGKIKMTITFIGHLFYSEDLQKGRLVDSLPDANPIVGFISSTPADHKKMPKNCHFARVQISRLEGLKEKNRIVFWTEEKNTFFSGMYSGFAGIHTYQITNVNDNTGELSINWMRLQTLKNFFPAEETKIKIVKIK